MHFDTSPAAAEVRQILLSRRDRPPILDTPAALARLAVLLRDLPVDECMRLGFDFRKSSNTMGQAFIKTEGPAVLPEGHLKIDDSPSRAHRAMVWYPTGARGVCLWIDGRAIALPVDESGCADTGLIGAWTADRFYSLAIIPEEHPLQDWSVPFSRGVQRSLFIIDTQTGRQWLEAPGPEELWTFPLIALGDNHCLLLYADDKARDAERIARVIPLQGRHARNLFAAPSGDSLP